MDRRLLGRAGVGRLSGHCRWRVRRLEGYGKYLLVGPSCDRSGAIGFRCVVEKFIGDTLTP